MVAVSLTQSHLRLLTDERLARLVGLGSEAAFAVLYGRHRPDLERYARALARDGHDADDGLQSAMLKAYGALRAGRRDAPVRPWLFRIVHNAALRLHRRRAPAPAPREPELLAVSSGTDVHEHVVAREELRGVIAGLELLTQHQRAALLMRRLGGLGYDEIALVLDTTPVAARQAVSTARRRLAESQQRPRLARLAGLLPLGPLTAVLRFFGEAASVAPGSGGGRAVAAAAVAVVAGVGAASDVAERVKVPVREAVAPAVAEASAPKAVLASAAAAPAAPPARASTSVAAAPAAARRAARAPAKDRRRARGKDRDEEPDGARSRPQRRAYARDGFRSDARDSRHYAAFESSRELDRSGAPPRRSRHADPDPDRVVREKADGQPFASPPPAGEPASTPVAPVEEPPAPVEEPVAPAEPPAVDPQPRPSEP